MDCCNLTKTLIFTTIEASSNHSYESGFSMKKASILVKNLIARATTPLCRGVRADCIGANPISWWLRKKLERISLKQMIGVNLAGIAFFSAIVLPQARDMVGSWEISIIQPNQPVITVVPTESTYQWPLSQFALTQRFSYVHPGMDLATSKGTPIYPVGEGKVAWINSYAWGYGNHVLITNGPNVQSLYAHLSRILVKPGEEVTKQTEIGEVGATGWATGNHLHFEIYQDGTPVNPLEVLPEITQ